MPINSTTPLISIYLYVHTLGHKSLVVKETRIKVFVELRFQNIILNTYRRLMCFVETVFPKSKMR